MKQPLVSVIVTTRNNATTIEACLKSIVEQTYSEIELIVVDNSSTDTTKAIATKFTKHVYDKGPERSAQRNFAVQKATGEYVLIIDSDMELVPDVVSACVTAMTPDNQAVIIPEMSFGIGFWAKCKALERSFYDGEDSIEAPRFFTKSLYMKVGGYDEKMVGGEDWDLAHRVRTVTKVARVTPRIRHNEGHPTLKSIVGKRGYYTQGFNEQYAKKNASTAGKVGEVLNVYRIYLLKPGKLFRNPIVGIGMLFMRTAEFGAIGFSLLKRQT